jgi:hypothetical protein
MKGAHKVTDLVQRAPEQVLRTNSGLTKTTPMSP